MFLFSQDLDPMPDREISMFQFDRSRWVDRVLGRPVHCGEVSLCLPSGWEIMPKYGALGHTDSADIVKLSRKRALTESGELRCAWVHPESGCRMNLFRLAREDYADLAAVEARLLQGSGVSGVVVDREQRKLRPLEYALVVGNTPESILSHNVEAENFAHKSQRDLRVVSAIYEPHTQEDRYALSITVPIPTDQPLRLMRMMSYSFSRFWVLPRPFLKVA